MKLLTKTSIYYFIFSLLVVVVVGFILYLTLNKLVYKHLDNSLLREKEIIEDQINRFDSVPAVLNIYGHSIEVAIFNDVQKRKELFKDTTVYDSADDEQIPYRKLIVVNNTKDHQNGYSISIMMDKTNQIQLLGNIFSALSTILVLLVLGLLSVNYWISKKVWVPFHVTLKKISEYDLLKGGQLRLPFGRVDEFRNLNRVIEQMANKIHHDYLNLKEFNENASHETQTPLAIIKSKLELIIQSESLSNEQMENLKTIYDATNRISKLNHGLLLISKIDNQQYNEMEEINLTDSVQKFLSNYEEIIEMKNIRIHTHFDEEVYIRMSKPLCEILISNLISNAIRHNFDGGEVFIELNSIFFEVKNTGNPIDFPSSDIFERFRKGKRSLDSVGLGLSIVKKIVQSHQMKIDYCYADNWHSMKVWYKK